MQYAVNLPVVAPFSDPRTLVDLAQTAEATGWDAVFVWDSLLFDQQWQPPIVDPWIILAAIATSTERVKIGTMIAQLARRRPWKVAREVVTLDHLSGDRKSTRTNSSHLGISYAVFGLTNKTTKR